jgi:anti-anti-sigma factor
MAPIAVSLDRVDPTIGVVTLIGEHDAYSARRLENELGVLFDSGVGIVIDLSEATFIDSQTLSVLLTGRNTAEQKARGFVLALSKDDYTQVHRILEMTGLLTAFVTRATVGEAVGTARAGLADPHRMKVA